MLKNINYKDDPLYNEKITNSSSYDELEFIWKTGEHCKNCDDCKERDGVIKTYKGWEEIGMPFSKILACAPNNECDCAMHAIDDYGHEDIFGNKYEVEYFDMDGNKVKFDDENQRTHIGYSDGNNIYRLDDNNKQYIAKDINMVIEEDYAGNQDTSNCGD